jgi:NADP-dependent 3-hydroxy acid dehydrogenase YdfG
MNNLITGATSGIGKATAELLAKKSIKSSFAEDGRPTGCHELSKLTEVHTLQFDVRDKKAVSEQINSLPEAFSKMTF